MVNKEDGTGTEVIYIAEDGSRVKAEPSAHAPKPQPKVKPIKNKIPSVLKAVEKVTIQKRKLHQRRVKRKFWKLMVVMVANDNLFSVPNFQMVMKESQEGYKQPTDSRDSALMSKVEAFFHEIDIKNLDEMVLKMKNANMNISALLGKTSETDTSADMYFDK